MGNRLERGPIPASWKGLNSAARADRRYVASVAAELRPVGGLREKLLASWGAAERAHLRGTDDLKLQDRSSVAARAYSSEHAVGVSGLFWHVLYHVPVLDDLAILQAKKVCQRSPRLTRLEDQV